jgi:hypothetical protein
MFWPVWAFWSDGCVSKTRVYGQRQGMAAYFIGAGTHEGIVAQIPTHVGCDDFTVDTVTGDEVLVHATAGRLARLLRLSPGCHGE